MTDKSTDLQQEMLCENCGKLIAALISERDQAIAAAQKARQDALEEAAKIASWFTLKPGASIHPDIPWDQMNESAQIAAHTTAQQIAGEILAAKDNAGGTMKWLWWCWHCMDLVPYAQIALKEDSGGCTGYCVKHPYRIAEKDK